MKLGFGLKGVYVGCIRLIKHISLNLLLKCQLQVYHLTNIYLDNIWSIFYHDVQF